MKRVSIPKHYSVIITVAFGIIALVYMFFPEILPDVKIDYVTITLLIIALLPWLFPYIKSIEIPGKIKIDTINSTEMKMTTDKVLSELPERKDVLTETKRKDHQIFGQIGETDPNLAVVGLGIEIEKRLRRLIEKNEIDTEGRKGLSLRWMLRKLTEKDIIPGNQSLGLEELINFRNQAAHGFEVEPSAADWVITATPRILNYLDSLIEE